MYFIISAVIMLAKSLSTVVKRAVPLLRRQQHKTFRFFERILSIVCMRSTLCAPVTFMERRRRRCRRPCRKVFERLERERARARATDSGKPTITERFIASAERQRATQMI